MPDFITTLATAPAARQVPAASQSNEPENNRASSADARSPSEGGVRKTENAGSQESQGAPSKETSFRSVLTADKSNKPASSSGTSTAAPAKSDAPEPLAKSALLVAALLHISQGESSPVQNAAATDSISADSAVVTEKNTDPLQELQILLQQLLQQATGGAATAKPQAASDKTDQTDGKTDKAKDTSSEDDDITAVLTQLLALLQQPAQTPALSASATPQATGEEAAPASSPQIQPLLAKLGELLQNADARSQSQNQETASSGSASRLFEQLLSKLEPVTQGKIALPAFLPPKSTADTKTSAPAAASQDNDAVRGNVPSVTDAIARAAAELTLVKNAGGEEQNQPERDANATLTATPSPVNSAQTPPAPPEFTKFVAAPAPTPHLPPAEQVLVQIRNNVAANTNEIKIQLQPENLGKVEVQLNTSAEGKTGITITADSRETLQLLQNEARSLENALRDIGLKTDTGGLNFNLRGDGGQNGRGNTKGGFTQVAAISEEDASSGTTLARYTSSYQYNLNIQQGLDIKA